MVSFSKFLEETDAIRLRQFRAGFYARNLIGSLRLDHSNGLPAVTLGILHEKFRGGLLPVDQDAFQLLRFREPERDELIVFGLLRRPCGVRPEDFWRDLTVVQRFGRILLAGR